MGIKLIHDFSVFCGTLQVHIAEQFTMNLRAVSSLTGLSLSALIMSLYGLSHVIGYSLCDYRVNQCDRNMNDLQNVTLVPDFQSERPSFLQLLPAPYVFPQNKTEEQEVANCVVSSVVYI